MKGCSENQWYELSAGFKRGRFIMGRATDLAEYIEPQDWPELFTGNLKLTAPIRVDAFRGTRPGDFVWCDPIPITCISQRVVDCFTEHAITGWAVYPVELTDRNGSIVPNYWGLSITGRIGYLVGSRSRLETREPVVHGGSCWRVYVGMHLDCSEWDGSDMCLSPGRYNIWSSERVALAVEDCGLTNADYMRIEQIEWNEALFATGTRSVKWEP